MRYISPIISAGSGSAGGATVMTGRGTNLVRAKVAPVARRTPAQSQQRSILGSIASTWRKLTQLQMQGWAAYAATVTLHNALGQPYTPSGFQLFVSCNSNLKYWSKAPVTKPPTKHPVFSQLAGLPYVATYSVGSGFLIRFAPTHAQPWSTYMPLIWSTPALGNGVSAVLPSMYRLMHPGYSFQGFNVSWQVPYLATFPHPNVGDRVNTRFTLMELATGLLSASAVYQTTVTSA